MGGRLAVKNEHQVAFSIMTFNNLPISWILCIQKIPVSCRNILVSLNLLSFRAQAAQILAQKSIYDILERSFSLEAELEHYH